MNFDAKITQKEVFKGDKEIVLALDTMGGRYAPSVVIEGAALALERYPFLKFILYGQETQVLPLLKKHKNLECASSFYHADMVVDDQMKPAVALRTARGSSMAMAVKAVADGKALGVISGGNTGAYMALSKIMLRMIPGICRPAIATYIPTERGGESVMLDLGANVACDVDNLVQFALMGSVFATNVLGVQNPSIGLLNVGEEELKGSPTLRQTFDILRAYTGLNFYGFVEGDDITKGTVDVVVTDGFTGNVALKTIEGTVRLMRSFLRDGFSGSLVGKLGYFFARPTLKLVSARMNPSRYNGAIFLGLNGVAIKSHGSTDALGFSSAIAVAVDMTTHGFKTQIEESAATIKKFISQLPESAVYGDV